MQGKIIKGIAGFYYVHVALGHVAHGHVAQEHPEGKAGVYECKAKGIFRKDQLKPLVGDDVELEVLDAAAQTGNIIRIADRSSQLIRPAVANVDQALVIFAVTSPQPNFNLLDRFLIMMKQQEIPCIVCFNKADLDEGEHCAEYCKIYEDCGYRTIGISTKTGAGIPELKEMLKGHTTTVAGPSGVGKSSLINCIQTERQMEIGDISKKIERGKHTTRHTELLPIEDSQGRTEGYILDTPGFSSLGLFDLEKEELAFYYPEFVSYEKNCRFGGCSHISEPDCGIKQALEEGLISPLRYENYCLLYEELKRQKKY